MYSYEVDLVIVYNVCFLLRQHILESTREDEIFDLVFSSDPDIIQNIKVRKETLGSGAHNIITLETIIQSQRDYTW